MPFLSGDTINTRLQSEGIIIDENDTNLFNNANIDCNSYSLSVGAEIFITSESVTWNKFKRKIGINSSVDIIRSGQFAFILTDEVIKMPHDLMGFISIRSKIKFKGLINVSGFHVDPGWNGHLLFAVYNAGPNDISLRKADKIFNIWFAKLDKNSSDPYVKKNDNIQSKIDSKYMDNLNGSIYSPQTLIKKIENLELSNRIWWIGLLFGLLLGATIGMASDFFNGYFDFYSGYRQQLRDELNKDIEAKFARMKQEESKNNDHN